MLIKGENLTEEQIKIVKNAYIHRLTTENGYPEINPCQATIEAISDKQWIKEHAFYFIKDGSRLSKNRSYCEPAYMADTYGNLS